MLNNRPSIDETCFSIAELLAKRSTCPRKQVGCVIINMDGRIVSTGYNGAPAGMPHCVDEGCIVEGGHCVRSVHAEMNAILYAAKNGVSLNGCMAFCTLLPCINCFNAFMSVGIYAVVYDEEYVRPERETLMELAKMSRTTFMERRRDGD